MIFYADIVMLAVTGLLCWIGIFSKAFHDNLLQRLGLGILAIFCWGRAFVVHEYGIGNELYVWSHFGTFLFAIGTWWKFSLRTWFVKHHAAWIPYGRRKEDLDVSV